MDELPEYLTIDEVADRYRTTVATLRYWRYLGTGPQAVKSGTGSSTRPWRSGVTTRNCSPRLGRKLPAAAAQADVRHSRIPAARQANQEVTAVTDQTDSSEPWVPEFPEGPQPTDHRFIRPGQVAPDRPAPGHCMRCGRPEADHRMRTVTFDLMADDDTYFVLTEALREFASRQRREAEDDPPAPPRFLPAWLSAPRRRSASSRRR